ncbi:uncharacterized protein EI90DRAFT_3132879 [Cantharellus anzutake]|uniref:uncharacterized protein n=1 Tax=Cantharellus anzutake TaxID=1750568 RepID=UPI0019036F7B|nr:uncharacterized protein EI90DRAFT_3132879 [Cantharellus anzutake]KAF8318901.1 hypothetical protein EI90DRAFT_3132879 [Cantharellus anzutake]
MSTMPTSKGQSTASPVMEDSPTFPTSSMKTGAHAPFKLTITWPQHTIIPKESKNFNMNTGESHRRGLSGTSNLTFEFPHHKDSALYRSFISYMESLQHDENWMPPTLPLGHVLQMEPHAFQEMLDTVGPLILVSPLGALEFNVSTLFGLMDFQGVSQCIDSDGDEDQILEMLAGDAAHEMCHWSTSRPLIMEHVPATAGAYQAVERLLNTHDVALAEFPVGHQVNVHGWRGPMISAVGSVHPPQQNPNGIGLSLSCASGNVVFFIPILEEGQKIIVDFDDVEEPASLGYEYLYQPPHQFSSFVLSQGQTVWLDRSSKDDSMSEHSWSSTVMACLMAMVLKAVHVPSTPERQPHLVNIPNLFSLASMALMFIGQQEHEIGEVMKALGHSCIEQDPKACAEVVAEFNNLRITNHAYKGDDVTPDQHTECDAKAAEFHQSMMTAVQNMNSS